MNELPPNLRLYRIVRSNPPSWVDFLSNLVKDLPPRLPERLDPLDWASISTFDSFDEAARRARRYNLGAFVAELAVPRESERLFLRQTYGRGHYSVLGGPLTLLNTVAGPFHHLL